MRSGFTLTEVIVAASFFLIAVIGIAGALSSGERAANQVRARVRIAFDMREMVARHVRADVVCAAPSGFRTFGRTDLGWGPGMFPGTRLVTVLVHSEVPGVRPESTGTLVGCP